MDYVLTNEVGHTITFSDEGRWVWVFSTRMDTEERVYMKMSKPQARELWAAQVERGYKRTK